MFYCRKRGGKRLLKKVKSNAKLRLAAFLVCLSMLAGLLPMLAWAEDAGAKLSTIVTFDSITLHYAGPDGQSAGAELPNGALIRRDEPLILRYQYAITEAQCGSIAPETRYYLEVSPHLSLPRLEGGAPLTIQEDGAEKQFGSIYADGVSAWVIFDRAADGTGTVLSEYGMLEDAHFYLNCSRAGQPPQGEPPLEGHSNLYAIKFENGGQRTFGYAENEPVTARAQISKDGTLTDQTITWTIDYTPWQNPSGGDPVDLDTSFELRDTIDASLHCYVDGSAAIDGRPVAAYTSRDEIQGDEEAYVLVETPAEGGDPVLAFGGERFQAGQATQGAPAVPLNITYQTTINAALLLPSGSGSGGGGVKNAARLFAGDNQVFLPLDITDSCTVDIPQPVWLTKTGTTQRNPGSGSTTEWTITFQPNGFAFAQENVLTLHDQLPAGSTLAVDSVQVNGQEAAIAGTSGDFTISPIITDNRPVTITYQSSVPEDMYNDGTSLGSNIAWFTFQYDGQEYATPQVRRDVGSGDGSGKPGTATLVKTNGGYNAADRTIDWKVDINPHRANLISGVFTDDLSQAGPPCAVGHTGGLALENGKDDIQVLIDGNTPGMSDPVEVEYKDQQITVTVGELGARTITLVYTTKVCDPCVFANNTPKTAFTNRISTENMIIGSPSSPARSASASSTATVSAAVLSKKPPVYDYTGGTMRWTVEVNGAGLPMEDIVLTDVLPDGLRYAADSLSVAPDIAGASANVSGQELTIVLGAVTGKTTVSFDTKIDPEILGFGGDQPVLVKNTIRMNGKADGAVFAEVSHRVEQRFSNHGLVKESKVNTQQELIQYEVLINPFGLALPENPSLVDTLDSRLQLDTDTLRFYEAELIGTSSANKDQRPNYTKKGSGEPLEITGFDPAGNSFTVGLPIAGGSRNAYVLAYTADIVDYQASGYSNSVRFDGGDVLLGGGKNNSANVGGGGGGGGGGVAARKAVIAVTKTDSETQAPLAGVTFTLYQWDSGSNIKGLPFAQGKTDGQGRLLFQVKPNGMYLLEETQSVPGYGSAFGWSSLPDGAAETDGGLVVTAGAARSQLELELTNEAHTTDICFRLVNESGVPMAGETVQIFASDPTGAPDAIPVREAAVSFNGTVKLPGMRRGETYYVRYPGGGMMVVEVPAQIDAAPKVTLPDGTTAELTAEYQVTGVMDPDGQWTLTVNKVIRGGTNPLAGATIGLYADGACQTLIKTEVSAQDGTVEFTGLIKGQRYWVKETAAPSGYQLEAAIYEADEANSTVTIENTPKSTAITPGLPSYPDNPNNPDYPGNPIELVEPVDPAEPAEPVEPDAPDTPDTPDEPDVPDSENVVTSDPDIPQTGDDTGYLIAATLFFGMMLAAMTAYRLWGAKKREKK